MSGVPSLPTPTELLRAPESALDLSPLEAAALLAQIEGLAAVLRLAAAKPSRNGRESADDAPPPLSEPACRWLTPAEAAAIASVPRRTVYGWSRRRDWRPFTHRLSRKVLRIEEAGFRRWVERQQ